jgi:hypothetical protein
VNFVWGGVGCYRENPQALKAFACDTNSGQATMIGSFAVDRDMPDFIGIEAVVNGHSWATVVPDWWQLYNAGGCRPLSVSASADFSTAPGAECVDPWNGQAAGGVSAWYTALCPPPPPETPLSASQLRFKVAYSRADPIALPANVEQYGFKVIVDYAKTVGTGACAGCRPPAGFGLCELKVVGRTTTEFIRNAIDNNCVSWQTYACYDVSPAQNATWGLVKSLYR